jgi:hypothetical protein
MPQRHFIDASHGNTVFKPCLRSGCRVDSKKAPAFDRRSV